MKYVQVTVDGKTYNLAKSDDGVWKVTNRAPLLAGDYLATVTLTTEQGQKITMDTTDEDLLKALTLLVREGTTESGNRMLNYYPWVVKCITEFQAITLSEGFEIDFANSDVDLIVSNAYLTTMSEERIYEWENMLNLAPNSDDTVEDRREKVIAEIRGNGKLNTALINAVVGAFTNGGVATSYVENSVLYIKILPPVGNKQFKFDNVVKAIAPKVPAHLGLYVTRDYATWGEVRDNFASWEDVAAQDDWDSIKLYIAPQ